LGLIFKLRHWDIHHEYLSGFIWGCPNAPKQHKKTINWSFWTISPKAMGLMIWLGIHKGPKVGGIYVPLSKLENRPLTKLLGPLF
jgi:hypothetical protein